MGWGARAIRPRGALVLQAVVFGLVHVGPDFTGNPIPVIVAVGSELVPGKSRRSTRRVHADQSVTFWQWSCCTKSGLASGAS